MSGEIRIEELESELAYVNAKELAVKIGDYLFIISRRKRRYHIAICKRRDFDVDILANIITKNIEEVADKLKEVDMFLAENTVQITETLCEYVKAWPMFLLKQKAIRVFFPQRTWPQTPWPQSVCLGPLSGAKESGAKVSICRFEDLLSLVSKTFNTKIAELFEVIATVSLTLKQVDRERMIFKNRPLWLLVISDPATYKTTCFDFFSYSKYWRKESYITAASLLSARKDVTPLIDLIHNRILVLPTLNEIASDRDSAARLFAALESIYDGSYSKATGLSGEQRRIVDTVTIAAITPMVWEKILLPKIIMFGSRWLVYRFFLSDEEALNIQKTLDKNKDIDAKITMAASRILDSLLENVTVEVLDSVLISEEQDRDLQVMAKLVSRLRAGWERTIYWYEDESGKKHAEEEIDVLQREAPGRAYQQLLNFVRANAIVRAASVERIVGLPRVDEHAMKLAFKLALGASHSGLTNLTLYLASLSESEIENLSQRDLAREVGVSRTQLQRYLKVLEHPRIGLIESSAYPLVKEPYRSLIRRYLGAKESG